jgi:hypothetical protein
MLQKREHYEKLNEHQLIFEDIWAELNLSHLPSDSGKLLIQLPKVFILTSIIM